MSGAVATFGQGVTTILQLLRIVLLARLVSPEEFGLFALSLAIVGIGIMAYENGVTKSIVQVPNITMDQLTLSFWRTMAISGGLFAVMFLTAPVVAHLMKDERLIETIRVLAVCVPLAALRSHCKGYIMRQMRFKLLVAGQITGHIAYFVTAVSLAFLGFGVWALVWGQIAILIADTCVGWSQAGWRPRFMNFFRGKSPFARMAAGLTTFDVVEFMGLHSVSLVIGGLFSVTDVGFYNRANNLARLPINLVKGPLARVAQPAMSRLQEDHERFRSYYCRFLEVLAVISAPLAAMLFVAGEDIIVLVLGERWQPSAPIFQILSLLVFILPVAGTSGVVMTASGKPGRMIALGLLKSGTIIAAISLATFSENIQLLAGMIVVAHTIVLIPMLALAFKGTGIRLRDFFGALAIPLGVAVVASLAGIGVRSLVDEYPILVRLACMGGTIVITFAVLLLPFPSVRRRLSGPWSELLGRAFAVVQKRGKHVAKVAPKEET